MTMTKSKNLDRCNECQMGTGARSLIQQFIFFLRSAQKISFLLLTLILLQCTLGTKWKNHASSTSALYPTIYDFLPILNM